MKYLYLSIFCFLSIVQIEAQENHDFKLSYEVNKTFPQLSVSENELTLAETLSDLVPQFNKDWIKTYQSVELTTFINDKRIVVDSKNQILTAQQKELLLKADRKSKIELSIKYIPNNSLTHNDLKELKYRLIIDPIKDAQFKGGDILLERYLVDHVMSKIPHDIFKAYQLTAVKFNVDEMGQVYNVHLHESTKDAKVDQILLDAICNMPDWIPAKFSNGKNTDQSFAFTVGDKNSCTVNLIHIHKTPPQ